MQLTTDRLVIRQLKDTDLDDLAAMDADSIVRRYIDGKTHTRDETRDYIADMMDSYVSHGFGRYAVVRAADQAFLGLCGFIIEDYGIDFGYRYAQAHWGQGYGIEAATAMIHYGLTDLKLSHVIGLADAENTGSIRILEKCGFTFTGEVVVFGMDALRFEIHRNPDMVTPAQP